MQEFGEEGLPRKTPKTRNGPEPASEREKSFSSGNGVVARMTAQD
jgi:hypothetical protein